MAPVLVTCRWRGPAQAFPAQRAVQRAVGVVAHQIVRNRFQSVDNFILTRVHESRIQVLSTPVPLHGESSDQSREEIRVASAEELFLFEITA